MRSETAPSLFLPLTPSLHGLSCPTTYLHDRTEHVGHHAARQEAAVLLVRHFLVAEVVLQVALGRGEP